MIIDAAYPNFKPDDLTLVTNTWFVMLQNYEYKDISEALKIYITTDASGFAPSIGQLLEKYRAIQPSVESNLTELEAWAMVYKAVCNSGYNSQEEFDKLPDTIRKVVGSPVTLKEWALMNTDSVNSVGQSQFLRSYRAEVKRKEEVSKLPTAIQERLKPVLEDKPVKQLPEIVEEEHVECKGNFDVLAEIEKRKGSHHNGSLLERNDFIEKG